MEQVIEFMEQYWGVTVVGGVTIGSIITFIIVQVRVFVRDRSKNVTINTLMDTVTNLIRSKHEDDFQKAEVLAKNEYMEKSMALLFKYISYLTVASKLPIEEKLKLQEETQALKLTYKTQLEEIAKAAAENVKEGLKETLDEKKDEVIGILDDAVENAGSLLDKYSGSD